MKLRKIKTKWKNGLSKKSDLDHVEKCGFLHGVQHVSNNILEVFLAIEIFWPNQAKNWSKKAKEKKTRFGFFRSNKQTSTKKIKTDKKQKTKNEKERKKKNKEHVNYFLVLISFLWRLGERDDYLLTGSVNDTYSCRFFRFSVNLSLLPSNHPCVRPFIRPTVRPSLRVIVWLFVRNSMINRL